MRQRIVFPNVNDTVKSANFGHPIANKRRGSGTQMEQLVCGVDEGSHVLMLCQKGFGKHYLWSNVVRSEFIYLALGTVAERESLGGVLSWTKCTLGDRCEHGYI